MKRRLLLFAIACILFTLLESCHTSQPAVATRSTRQPKFISNIYIDPHAKTSATTDAIDRTKRPERPKPAAKPQYARQTGTTTASIAKNTSVTIPPPRTEDHSSLRQKYAEIIGTSPEQLINAYLYKFIDKWYGTNYRIGGCDVRGIDCSGFAQKLYSEVYGVDLLRTAMDQFSNCKRIQDPDNASEGDLVFFHIQSRRITHVGVYLGNKYFVHASTHNGVMISSLEEDYWHKYYAGCGRIPKG